VKVQVTKSCDECGSAYVAATSVMEKLCSECAYWLYGHSPCVHVFDTNDKACTRCGWNGTRSAYVQAIIDNDLGSAS
jgi:hypothetical protein